MRVGLIVEGQAEYSAIPALVPTLRSATGHTIVGPTLAPVHPTSAPEVLARGCRNAVGVLELKRVELIVVLLDKEDCPCCSGDRAVDLERALSRVSQVAVKVVLKHRTFENWLISDIEAVKANPGRFTVTVGAARRVSPNKADHVDGIAWLSQASGGTYEKVADARRILDRASIDAIGANSRSFRRFLRVLNHPTYVHQSSRPA